MGRAVTFAGSGLGWAVNSLPPRETGSELEVPMGPPGGVPHRCSSYSLQMTWGNRKGPPSPGMELSKAKPSLPHLPALVPVPGGNFRQGTGPSLSPRLGMDVNTGVRRMGVRRGPGLVLP